jgi:hypothetical protein
MVVAGVGVGASSLLPFPVDPHATKSATLPEMNESERIENARIVVEASGARTT